MRYGEVLVDKVKCITVDKSGYKVDKSAIDLILRVRDCIVTFHLGAY